MAAKRFPFDHLARSRRLSVAQVVNRVANGSEIFALGLRDRPSAILFHLEDESTKRSGNTQA